MSYANNKGADQRAHPSSLISGFLVRCLDSVMSAVSVTKVSSPMLASVAEQASLSLTSSEPSEDTFSHGEAQIENLDLNLINQISFSLMQKCLDSLILNTQNPIDFYNAG